MMKSLRNKTALITGASSGIGEAFAWLLAAKGVNLLLTARSAGKLTELSTKIKEKHAVDVFVLPADLSAEGAAGQLSEQIRSLGQEVDLLINNAGFGKWTPFHQPSADVYPEMIRLNITAPTELCQLLLPDMIRRGEGGIINVASTGAFQPCPGIAVYAASKAFVLSFSEALHGEYAHRGISVTALCPGNTATGFQGVAGADTRGMTVRSAAEVAQQGLDALLRGKSYKVTSTADYLQSLLPRLLPRKMVIGIVSEMMKKRIPGLA